MLSFDDPVAAPYVGPIPEADLEESWQLIAPDGARLEKGRALVALLEEVDATRLIGRAFRALRLYWLAHAIDRALDALRPHLSRVVPDRPGPQRTP